MREKRGLAYSVYSYLLPFNSAALYLGGAGTQNGRVKESLETIKAVLVDMRENGVSAEELANAKTYINGSFPLRLTSSGKIAVEGEPGRQWMHALAPEVQIGLDVNLFFDQECDQIGK